MHWQTGEGLILLLAASSAGSIQSEALLVGDPWFAMTALTTHAVCMGRIVNVVRIYIHSLYYCRHHHHHRHHHLHLRPLPPPHTHDQAFSMSELLDDAPFVMLRHG